MFHDQLSVSTKQTQRRRFRLCDVLQEDDVFVLTLLLVLLLLLVLTLNLNLSCLVKSEIIIKQYNSNTFFVCVCSVSIHFLPNQQKNNRRNLTLSGCIFFFLQLSAVADFFTPSAKNAIRIKKNGEREKEKN